MNKDEYYAKIGENFSLAHRQRGSRMLGTPVKNGTHSKISQNSKGNPDSAGTSVNGLLSHLNELVRYTFPNGYKCPDNYAGVTSSGFKRRGKDLYEYFTVRNENGRTRISRYYFKVDPDTNRLDKSKCFIDVN